MTNKKLRADEEFVISAVASCFSGTWRPGEDPPDAYLELSRETVAVEISTLTQYVDDYQGKLIPRFLQDATALRLIEELNKELCTEIPHGTTVKLALESPLKNKRKLKPLLIRKILEMVNGQETAQIIEYRVFDNKIDIQVDRSERPWGNKVVGIVINEESSSDISMNARWILEHRISVKDKKCRSLSFKGPFWLALFNDYWLADVDTYKKAIATSAVPHRFDKILLVRDNKDVATLYAKREEKEDNSDCE